MMSGVLNATKDVVHAVQSAYDYYLWTLTLSDKRTQGWLFVDSPGPVFALIYLYLLIVYFGPKWMKDREPFKLSALLIMYNISMALLNFWICAQLFISSYKLNYSYICEPCRMSYHPDELKITRAVWWYFFSKLLEFTDTFFFILRKKHDQLSFLHIYHHSTMFFFWWIGIKWVPTGTTFLPAMANSLIHVLMYTYYGLSVLGPKVTKYLWWKKYLTIIQMIQFTTALALGINGIFIGCDFPLWMHYTLILYMISFIVLFGKFYVKAYIQKYKDYREMCQQRALNENLKSD
uniref:Elongation of very long chain fatty acids protein n=1 Tax=Culicoides sonorensis TaxID=179676 RepID=A0A336M8W2_CULSO